MADDNVLILVGNRIREIRKKKGWSQEKLGEKATLSYSYIGRMENGKNNISLLNLHKIAEALEVGIHEFFSQLGNFETLTWESEVQKEIILLVLKLENNDLLLARNILNEIFNKGR